MANYDIAAYIWPAYTGDEPRTRMFWEEGMGEWQTVRNARVKENGYLWRRRPLWGYVNEADPYVMRMQIDAAADHGVNVFIYDWYWYDGRPFLENCLNDGFLKAPNCDRMQFYIMWANHDANHLWDIRHSDSVRETIWRGSVDRAQFEIIGRRWIEQYFVRDNYYRIDGLPVVSIYDMNNFVQGLGGVAQAAEAMAWLREQARQAGLGGVHFQFVRWNGKKQHITGADGETIATTPELVESMGFDSLTHYQFVHFVDVDRDYDDIMVDVEREWSDIAQAYRIPYYPHVSVGWDNNPRHHIFKRPIVKNNTPAAFERALWAARRAADAQGVRLITINSWNEWTETSYLEPDDVNGYGYLQAIRKVFAE